MSAHSGTATAEKAARTEGKPATMRPRDHLSKEDCLEMLRQLYLARYFDVRLIKEKKKGKLTGTLYSSHNQEAILVGSVYGLRPYDWLSPIHRDMPAFFLKDAKFQWDKKDRMGMSIEEVCAQVWGKVDSPGRARDNWSHIGDQQKHIICSTSMLAGTIPAAAGVVYADRLDGGDAVAVTYNGEGSTAQGIFHEAINYAAVHKLSVITIIENNQWAFGTPTYLEYPLEDFARRADGFGIPGLIADGQDVFDVYDKVMISVDRARAGLGPSIVECKTFRAYGHGDHDNDRADKYRTKEEIEEGRRRDPIHVCKERLLELGHITKEQSLEFGAEHKSAMEVRDTDFPPEVVAYMSAGVDFALKSALPESEEAAMWVFKESQ
ncbi:MAG: thiamine pyrophosphate-dependent dehydrogenase E1 component subunit alpha [Fimbriimonas sp.]